MVKLPEVWRASATRTLIDIQMYKYLYAVLRGSPSGSLVHIDEGHLFSALGASGPDVSSSKLIRPTSTSATDIIRVHAIHSSASSLHSRCSLTSRARPSVLRRMERSSLIVPKPVSKGRDTAQMLSPKNGMIRREKKVKMGTMESMKMMVTMTAYIACRETRMIIAGLLRFKRRKMVLILA